MPRSKQSARASRYYADAMTADERIPYGDGRSALITAAVDTCAEKGLRGLTFRAVSERAGVNNALIAHHFGNREGLLIAALEWSVTESVKATGLPDAGAHPQAFEDAFLDSVRHTWHLLLFQYELILEASRNERLREPVTDLYRTFFRSLMPEGSVKSDALTRARFATLDGLVLQAVSGAITPEEFEESVHAAAGWLWGSPTEAAR